tara:strand:- start:626 stop:817 length:192 start_codon:yes stop_codon:yes gene_type:complete
MGNSKKKTIKKNELEPIWHPTQHDESDELEDAKRATEKYKKLLKGATIIRRDRNLKEIEIINI